MDQCIALPEKLFRSSFIGPIVIGPKRKQPPNCTLNDAGQPVNENQDRGTRLQIQGKDDNGGMEIETNPYRYQEFLKENGT
jgi:hypothetical protein